MDYSLLIGVKDEVVREGDDEEEDDETIERVETARNIHNLQLFQDNCVTVLLPGTRQVRRTYHLGIVDFLQDWNAQKQAAKRVKDVWYPGYYDKSTEPPGHYAQRFAKRTVGQFECTGLPLNAEADIEMQLSADLIRVCSQDSDAVE